MPFNFAEAKCITRQAVHDTLAVCALYQDSSISSPVPITARLHNATRLIGDMDHEGYAQVDEATDRVVLLAADAEALSIKVGGKLTFPDYGITVTLHFEEPITGPIEVTWRVSR